MEREKVYIIAWRILLHFFSFEHKLLTKKNILLFFFFSSFIFKKNRGRLKKGEEEGAINAKQQQLCKN